MDQNSQILIVEDDETLLNNTRRALETAGYQPVCTHSGREALELIAQRPFVLALVDLDLVDVSGLEVCRQIKAAQPAFVVMLTGALQGTFQGSASPPAGDGLDLADGFITRPIPDQELLAHLHAYLRLQQTQAALQASEARFRQLYESMIDGYDSVDLEGRFLDFNEAFLNMLGYTAEELRQLTYFDVTPEKWHAFEAKIVEEQILPRGYSDLYQKEYRRKDGAVFPVELHTVLLRDESGKPTATWAIVRDMTERKQAEQALRLERDRAQKILDAAEMILMTLDSQCQITLINQPGSRILGYPEGELGGKDWITTCLPVSVREQVRIVFRQILAGEIEAEYYENPVLTKAGEERTVAWHNTLLRDEHGKVTGVLSAGMDITARKQVEQALEWERYLMRALMDNIPDAIYFKDCEGRYFLANQAMLGLHPGLKRLEEIYGKTDFDFFDPETAREFYDLEQTVIRSGQPIVNLEHEEKWPGRPLTWASSTKMPLRDANGTIIGTFGVSRDITRHKQTEEALVESEERYYSLFQNASIGIFHSLPDGRYLRANPALAHTLGYSSPEELISSVTNIQTQVYANPDRYTRAVTAVTQQDDWLHAENQYRRKDGRLITGSLALRRVLNPDGTLAYLEGFVEDITQRRRIEDELRLDEQHLQGLLEISQHQAEGIEELLAFAVRQAIDLTGSRLGYLFSYDEQKQELTLNTRSMEAMQECTIPSPKSVYRLDETGLSGEPIRQRQPVLVNDFQDPHPLKHGYPEGHTRIERFLSIPIFSQERIVGVMAVANKVEEYDQADLRQLNLLMSSVWRMVETQQSEQRLRQSEERLRYALEADNDGLWDEKVATGQTYYSPRYYTMLGYQPSEFPDTQTAFMKLVHPDDLARVQQALEDYYAGRGDTYEIEFRMLARSGEVVWILSRAKATQRDTQGRPLRMVGTHTDITRRKQAEEALKTSEERYRRIFTDSPLGIVTSSQDLRFLTANAAFCRMLGYREAELSGMTFKDITHPAHVGQDLESVLKLMRGDIPLYRTEKRYLRKDGQVVWASTTVTAIRNLDGQFLYNLAMVEDISERKQAEEALRASEERFRQVTESTGDFIWEENPSGLFMYASPAVEKILGYTPDELVGKKYWYDLLSPDTRQAVKAAGQTAFANKESFYTILSEYVHKDGRRIILESSGSPVLDAAGNLRGYRGADTDVTERILAEQSLRASEARLKQAERMAHLGSFSWDADTKTRIWSDEMYRITGKDLGTPAPSQAEWARFFTPESWSIYEPTFQRAVSAGEPYDLEMEMVRPDGVVWQAIMHGAAVTDAAGQVVGLHGTLQDVSELRQAQENLHQAHQQLNAIIQASPLGISAIDGDGRLTLWSPACERLYGWTQAEVLGQEPPMALEELHAEVRQQIREELQGTQRSGEVYSRRRKDGTLLDISLSTAPLRDSRGNITGSMAIVEDISQRKRAEEALRESETKFRAIFENSRDAIDVSQAGLHVYVNPAFLQLFGYSGSDEIDGQSLFNLVAPEDRQRIIDISGKRTLGQDAPDYYETRGLRKDGSQFDMEVKADTYELQSKRYTLAVMRDVTERKQAEEALRRSEERYRMLADNMTDLVWVMGTDLKYTYFSPSTLRQRGYTMEELNALPLDQQIAPHSLEKFMQLYREILGQENPAASDQPQTSTLELEVFRKDGSSYWSETTFTLIQDKQGKLVGILGSGRDVTERKRAEQALRESEERFRTFIEQSAEAVSLVDEEGRLIEWNDSMERLSGLKRQEVAGKFFWDVLNNLIPPEKRSQQAFERNRAALIQALQTGQSPMFNHTIEGEVTRPDGERRDTRQTAFPIKTEKGFRLGSVSQDITKLKQTEALRLAKETAEMANRAKSEFLANMSHELRTPLNAMLGFSDMLSQQYYGPLTGKQVEYVQDIHESAAYLLALINDILDLSKIEAGRMDLETSQVDLQSLFEHSLVMVRERANTHALFLSSNIDPRLAGREFLADERKLRQVLYNLLANAVKFTPDGGAVDLSARLVDGVEGQDRPWLEVSVTDTGIGLAVDDLKLIFEAFYQVKTPEAGKTPGTGLGLSLVRRMVELHGGQVWAESKGPGWGSRFVFTLPLLAAQPGEEA